MSEEEGVRQREERLAGEFEKLYAPGYFTGPDRDKRIRNAREDAEYAWRNEAPYWRRAALEAIDAAAARDDRPTTTWVDVDTWTRADFFERVKQDQKEGRSGSKVSIAQRVHLSPTALWRRWEKVQNPGESWPSGKKGPADR